jgi:aminoglycoside/choline kinase family phosphotransferase
MSARPNPAELLPWALESLSIAPAQHTTMKMIAGDASNRRYFRLEVPGATFIGVEAPTATEKNTEFVAIREVLAAAGVRVPKLYATDLERGFMLLEDLGDRMLLPVLTPDSVASHYQQAFSILHKMATVDHATLSMPAYDYALLSEELGRFSEWFVAGLLGYELRADERALIGRLQAVLLESALEQPRVLVHRDFHSRNLMLLEVDQLAVIDFQDAVIGPITYDLASLLKDCYIAWPAAQVRRWVLDFRDSMPVGESPGHIDDVCFLRWFDFMALQRHIKVLGTFARLYLRDGKTAYLRDLPLVVRYIEEVLVQYADEEPVLAEFHRWFGQALSPLISQQSWGGDR